MFIHPQAECQGKDQGQGQYETLFCTNYLGIGRFSNYLSCSEEDEPYTRLEHLRHPVFLDAYTVRHIRSKTMQGNHLSRGKTEGSGNKALPIRASRARVYLIRPSNQVDKDHPGHLFCKYNEKKY